MREAAQVGRRVDKTTSSLPGTGPWPGSGGSEPGAEINQAAEAMAEVGIAIFWRVPEAVDGRRCSGRPTSSWPWAAATRPLFPGKRYDDCELTDPFGKGVEEVRPIRDRLGVVTGP